MRAVIAQDKDVNGNAKVLYYSDYFPYGTNMALANYDYRYGYQGKYAEIDPETGWNNFDLRMYDPTIGRWMSVDPYGQYWSPYMAMGDNPINSVDPDGGFDENGDPGKGNNQFIKHADGSYEGNLKGVTITTKRWSIDQRITYRMEMGKPYDRSTVTGAIDKAVKYREQAYAQYAGWGTDNPLQKGIYNVVEFYATGAVAGKVIGTAWNLGKGLYISRVSANAGARVFWSGGKTARLAAEGFAKANNMTTLEMTLGGRIMTKLNPILPRSISNPIWSRLSSNFASGARGTVNVFHNATEGVRIKSVWAEVEYGILKSNNIKITYHPAY